MDRINIRKGIYLMYYDDTTNKVMPWIEYPFFDNIGLIYLN